MTRYRHELPQLQGGLFVTDGGLETTLIFHDGLELPYFAAFALLEREDGRARLGRYFRTYAEIARRYAGGFVLESPTWRASADWGARLGYTPAMLAEVNRQAIALLEAVRSEYEPASAPVVISGCIGPRGDGYTADTTMNPNQAKAYHAIQVETFADTAADLVSAFTITYADEAVGITGAAQDAGIPVVISFTLETDGKLPSGQALGEAVRAVDDATGGAPAYYMINCAHPTHFDRVLSEEAPWRGRIRGIRANASAKSHAELDDADELDDGDPVELGARYLSLRERLPRLNVLGGCCGTDHRHVEEICRAWTRREGA